MFNNNNNNDCGCKEEVDILNNPNTSYNRNFNQTNNMMNNIQNQNQNQNNFNNNIHNQNNLNSLNNNNVNLDVITNGTPNTYLDNLSDKQNNSETLGSSKISNVKLVINFLLALSIHEMCKFFINQSIRLNRGTSARYIYYPILILVIFIIFNIY